MKGSRFISVTIALALLLALSAGLTAAQGPAPQGGGQPQTQIGSAFTYQGQLQKDGALVDDTCSMAFSLYDDASAGNMAAGPITMSVTVADGLFTVPLDFGAAFTGEALWLAIKVKCSGDAAFNDLSPRQALTAAPYALSLRPGAFISGAVSDGAILYVYNADTEASLYAYGLMGRVSSTKGYGVYGHANAFSGATYGVFGRADSPEGTGLFGHATAATGNTYGVFGQTDSPGGRGVAGYAGAGSGEARGVYGRTEATGGTGVYGYASATSGYTNGVVGTSDSTGGNGVAGYANALSGLAWGVYGQTESTDGTAVRGYATADSGKTYGVAGQVNSSAGRGVYGLATATSGITYGVIGQVNSSAGVAVYGNNTSASSGVAVYGVGPNAVVGDSSTPNYGAVVGRNFATTGTGMGVYGSSASTDGQGVYGYASAASGGNAGVVGETDSPTGWGVYAWGELGASGTKSAVVQTPGYGWRRLYALESAEVLFEDVGTAQLVDGQAVVAIDPVFAQTVNLEQPYQVFLTPQGGYCALYVAEKTTASFTVRAQEGSSCQIAFDYRIIAKRLGYEDVRLEPAQPPARARNEPGAPDPTGTNSSVAVPAHEGKAQMRPAPDAAP